MRYLINETSTEPERVEDDTVEVRRFFDDDRGCEKFAQRGLRFAAGRSRERVDPDSDEALYVLEGSATATIGGTERAIAPGTGIYVSRSTPWSIESDEGIDLLSVRVHDPDPAPAGAHAVVDLRRETRAEATAARQFTLGLTPAVGCASVTQFIGHVPPGRAPDHFHAYDEVITILEGEGVLHIGDDHEPFGPGSCIHLPSRLVHCLENTGDEELHLLGVFRPAGSPAVAYYPDGTPATYPGSAKQPEGD